MIRARIAVMALLSAAFAVLAYFAHVYAYFPSDPGASYLIQQPGSLLPVMRALSAASSFLPATIIVAAVVGLLAARKRRLEAILVGAATGLASLANLAIKDAVGRPRPDPGLVRVLDFPQNPAFPSGHTLFALVFYGLLIYFVPGLIGPGRLSRIVQWSLGALIVATAVSRVYLGAHWASDALGSFLAGGLVLTGVVGLYCHYQDRFRREHA